MNEERKPGEGAETVGMGPHDHDRYSLMMWRRRMTTSVLRSSWKVIMTAQFALDAANDGKHQRNWQVVEEQLTQALGCLGHAKRAVSHVMRPVRRRLAYAKRQRARGR
jgi:hypothetical protein